MKTKDATIHLHLQNY